ncbi:nucleotidyl transferase AbiEii/AbiGii toxin family protein [candidate division KSB1 bacterium]|nr:nucleotidyl transferase AbiEii/AbiGii toxin family protein [candidate division KSB1 bacterium]
MKEIIQNKLASFASREDKLHRLREFLQLIVLQILSEGGYFQRIAFVGGTALRFLFQLQRYSEDLDFSVTQPDLYEFEKIEKSIALHLEKLGFDIYLKTKCENTVQRLYIRFENLLHDLGLSPLQNEKLSIRVEIDANPPKGWKCEMSLINDIYIFPVWHFDLSSLFATKIHACFFRKFRKGRDYYDLLWYLSKKVQPNFELLNNAIQQTEERASHIGAENFKEFLYERLQQIDFGFIQRDVSPFLVSPQESELLTQDVFFDLVRKY